MSDKVFNHGRFCWRELMSTNLDASRDFYAGLFGWTYEVSSMGNDPYVLAYANGKQIAGLMGIPTGAPPHAFWNGYVSLPEVDPAANRAKELGGTVLAGPMDIPHVGRFATVMDPQGAVFTLFASATGGDPITQPGAGEFCWEQLNASDPGAAEKFYGAVTGWTTKGFEGEWKTFFTGDDMVASVGPAPADGPGSHWLTFVAVASLAASRDKAVSLGGTVLLPEMPVTGFGRFAVLADNVGAVICIFESAST